jgi:hypothetical protein
VWRFEQHGHCIRFDERNQIRMEAVIGAGGSSLRRIYMNDKSFPLQQLAVVIVDPDPMNSFKGFMTANTPLEGNHFDPEKHERCEGRYSPGYIHSVVVMEPPHEAITMEEISELAAKKNRKTLIKIKTIGTNGINKRLHRRRTC